MAIKLEQYKIFNECARTLSFSKAARNLFVTQSAVSQTIKLIERELNVQLFVRQSKGVVLTREGEILFTQIDHALNLILNVENQMESLMNLEYGELVIAASDTFAEFYLSDKIAKFHKVYPHVKIKVINRTTFEIINLLKNNQVDLGFINNSIKDDSLIIRKCLTIHDIFVSNKFNPLIHSYEEISQKDLIMLEKSSNSRYYIEHEFKKENVKLFPKIEVGHHRLLIDLALKGLGVSCIIQEFSQDYLTNHQLYEIKVTPKLIERAIGCAYIKHKILPAAAKKFTKFLTYED